MMTVEDSNGERLEVPKELLEYTNDNKMIEALPIRLSFSDKEFILEIMLFLDLSDLSNLDKELNYLRFARTSEGFVLLVDLNGEDFKIMQEEFDDIDHLGLTLSDLRKAEWVSI